VCFLTRAAASGLDRGRLCPFDFRDLIDAPLVASAGERGGEPQHQDFLCERERDDARAEREDVRVVVLPRHPGRVEFVAQRRACADDFVRRHLLALAAAADDDAAIGPPLGDLSRDLGADRRIVDRSVAMGAAIVHDMAAAQQRTDQMLLQRVAGVIGADRYPHMMAIIQGARSAQGAEGRPGMETVVVTRRGEERVRVGHPWIYKSDVAEIRASPGATVRVVGPRKRVLGQALYSDRSEIALRLLTRGEQPADPALWRSRIEHAIQFRESLKIDATAYRLVHGEADLLPSLVVDRYGDYLVVQTLSQGVDRLLPQITGVLVDIVKPAGILARNDPRVRLLEGLEQRVEVLHGTVPQVIEVREGHVTYLVDPFRGQKTGLFLDQRENRVAAAEYASGRVLDAFSYNGGFALALARRSHDVLAVDISDEAVARIKENAERNGATNITARAMNVFDELRELERRHERFDTIVLDPPAFAKNKASVGKALSGYKEINLRALKLLTPGGFLVTCSCSYNVSEADFADVIASAAVDAHADVAVVEKRMQGRDHPVLMTVPETYYLKCFILRKLR
jgi:23S rRNA (cytosine1962-C5)-methyltransferase